MNPDRIDAVLAAYYSDDPDPDLEDLLRAGVTVDEMAVVLDTLRLDLSATRAARPSLRQLVDEFLTILCRADP